MMRLSHFLLFAVFCVWLGHALQHQTNQRFTMDSDAWRGRAIYQVLTDRFANDAGINNCGDLSQYQGGTWKGIEQKLAYIKDMGFDAVWISPIVSQIGNGYHGYWMKDLSQLNSHFGSENDLKQLVSSAHQKGIAVMVDVVANHVGPVDMDFSQIQPFNQSSHYHDKCQITDFQNQQQVEYCRLSNLPDLMQENNFVSDALTSWIHDIMTTYGFDGVRIDTTPEVPKTFWVKYRDAAGSFCMGEVYDGRIDYVSGYQGTDALQSVLSYPLFFTLRNVFQQKQSMYQIQNTLQSYAQSFSDMSVLGTFIDNHDQPRFLSGMGDHTLYKNAIAFVLMAEGIPIIYYGTEQGYAGSSDPNNRECLWPNYDEESELYKFIKTVLQFRKKMSIATEKQVQRYADDTFYAFTRGDVFVATTNVGSQGDTQTRTITYHPYKEGTTLCNLFYPSDCVSVKNNQFDVVLTKGEVKIFAPN